jgi:hypothetical protein
MDLGLRDRFNKNLKEAIRAENDYALKYMFSCSSGFKDKADALENLFEKDFNYQCDHISRFGIPLKKT